MRLSRRQLFGAGLAGAGALALTGCGRGGPDDRTTLQFWHPLSGGDGIIMAGLLDEINEAQNDYYVRPTVLEWGEPYYTKLAMAGAGGRAPELAIMHSARVPAYYPGGLLDPWDMSRLAELGVSEEQFSGPVWENSVIDGELWSVPLDAHPFVMFYNTEICEAAGVLDSDGQLLEPDGPEGFLDICRQIADYTGGNGLSFGFLGEPPQIWRLFYTFYAQHGVEMSFPEGGPAEIDDDAFIGALEYMARLTDGEVASSRGDRDSSIAEFSTGQTGIFFDGVWELATMNDAELPVNMGMIPTVFGTPVTYSDSHCFVLPHQQDPDEEARDHAYEFVARLLEGSLDWADAGHIPAYLPVTESSEYAELTPQSSYADAIDHVVYDPTAWFTGSGSNFINEVGQMIQGSMVSGEGFEDTLERFRSYVDGLLEGTNPVDPEGSHG